MIPRPFRVNVTDEAWDDLRRRLSNMRWPNEVNDECWSYGMDLTYLKELVSYWRNEFDWRRAEAHINRLDQFTLTDEGLDIHFVHQRSPHPNAKPLIINHGWPGSIVEFLEVIPRLTEPDRFGGNAEDAWHVVCPSLPGYGYSSPANRPGMHPGEIAARHARLMAALGYERYATQGGDWGSAISQEMAARDPAHCRAVHLNAFPAEPPADMTDPMSVVTDEEKAWMAQPAYQRRDDRGYREQHATRPQTVAYGLNDSPVGLCAWIAEKFHFWTDNAGDIRDAIAWDALLTNISLYWFTGTIASSIRLYKEYALALERREVRLLPRDVPTGIAVYPREFAVSPRAWAERRCHLIHWFRAPRGGHFAAMEQPALFADDLCLFKRQVAPYL